jgi:hypothetical protein
LWGGKICLPLPRADLRDVGFFQALLSRSTKWNAPRRSSWRDEKDSLIFSARPFYL